MGQKSTKKNACTNAEKISTNIEKNEIKRKKKGNRPSTPSNRMHQQRLARGHKKTNQQGAARPGVMKYLRRHELEILRGRTRKREGNSSPHVHSTKKQRKRVKKKKLCQTQTMQEPSKNVPNENLKVGPLGERGGKSTQIKAWRGWQKTVFVVDQEL